MFRLFVPLTLVSLLLIVACSNEPVSELVGEELFSLSFGVLDEQLDLFRVDDSPTEQSIYMTMRDGLFYIVDGNAGKVMQFSSYGDLLLIIYDQNRNPVPVGLPNTAPGETRIRQSKPYEFQNLSHIAVDSHRRIYVVDSVVVEESKGYRQVVRNFSPDGELVVTIGREGANGSPFPYVHRLTVTSTDELVVTSRTPTHWLCYWYTTEGILKGQAEFPLSTIREDSEQDLVIWEVFPQITQRRLLVFFYETENDFDNQVIPEVELYDLATRSVIASFRLPHVGPPQSGASLPVPFYYPLGLTMEDLLFLTRREDEHRHSIMVVGRGGRLVTHRHFGLEESGLEHVSIEMNTRGMLYGMLVESEQARVIVWHSDSLLQQH